MADRKSQAIADRVTTQGRALGRTIEAISAIRPTARFERAIACLLSPHCTAQAFFLWWMPVDQQGAQAWARIDQLSGR
jgi:hypothetical protein